MIRLDTRTEFIYMQFTGARPKTSGYRKLENVLGSFPSDSCPHSPALGKQEVSTSKRIRRVLLGMRSCHKVSEPEQGEEDLCGGLQ